MKKLVLKNKSKNKTHFKTRYFLPTCALLCSVSTLTLAQSIHQSSNSCPQWQSTVDYASPNYPVQYNGQVYVTQYYVNAGSPAPSYDPKNPWDSAWEIPKDVDSACANIPAPGTPTIEDWQTKNTYDSGVAVPIYWDMYSGNPSSTWEVLDNDVSIYNHATSSAQGNSAKGNTSLTLASGQHILKVRLCTNNSCSVSAPITVTIGGNPPPPPPPPTLPTPSITSPANEANSNQSFTVSWQASATNAPASTYYWTVQNTGPDGKLVITDKNSQFSYGSNQLSGATSIQVNSTGAYQLQVNLCDSASQSADPCNHSSVVKVNVSNNPPPPPTTPAKPIFSQPSNGGTYTNSIPVNWSAPVDNANDNSWKIIESSGVKQKNTIFSSDSLTINDSGESGSTTLTTLSAGQHTLQVQLCNANQCTLSDKVTVNFSTTPPATSKKVMGYYSNWTVYNTKLRHGGTGNDPYGLSGIQYQLVPHGDIYKMETNKDAEAQMALLDIIAYAFAEVYPSYSVQYNASTDSWDPIEKGTYQNGTNGNPDNRGKIFLSDPWSDLTTADYGTTKVACNENNMFSSADAYSHELCLGGYETVISGQTGAPKTQGDTNPTGAVLTSQDYQNNKGWWSLSGNLDQFSQLKADHPNLKRIVSIGGWFHEDAFEAGAFVNPQNFINSLEALMDKFDLDGVDLDYEPGSWSEPYTTARADKFVSLVQQLRAALDSKYGVGSKLITTAVTANPETLTTIDNGDKHNWKILAQDLDYISIMGYDFHGEFDAQNAKSFTDVKADFHSNLFQDSKEPSEVEGGKFDANTSVQALISLGVPAKKILLGIPSYARVVSGVTSAGDNSGLYQQYTGTSFLGDMDSALDQRHEPQGQQSYYGMLKDETDVTNSTQIKAWINNGYKDNALSNALGQTLTGKYAAWMFNDAQKNFAPYDSADVVTTKANYVMQQNLGGMMMWELSSDTSPVTDSNTSLLCAMTHVLHDGNSGKCNTSSK